MKLRSRREIVARIRRRLERVGYPRLQMLLIVAITGGFGFVASFLLLAAGMNAMWLRYPCAVLVAYLAFLLLLWLWLRTRAEDYVDAPDPGALPDLPKLPGATFSGGEGTGGGGGASASFDVAESDATVATIDVSPGDLPCAGDAVAAVGDADELAIPLAFIVLIGVLLLSSLWIVYSAPVLLAELLLDGVLSTTLYRHLRRMESQHWLQTAVSRTAWMFLGLAVVAGIVGAVMAWDAPGARSLGELIRHHESQP